MAEKKKKPEKKDRPVKMKDGSIKVGSKKFKNEKEFMAYMDKMPIIDGKKK